MEQATGDENVLNNTQEQKLSFDQKLILAKALNRAIDDRNIFIQNQGGFDDFAEVGQYADNLRNVYDELEQAVAHARKEFDEKIHDKNEFVQQLKNIGEASLATRLSSMFSIPQIGFFRRIFKK